MSDQYLRPFGNPEGARAEIDEITNGFVEFPNPHIWGGLATKPSDLTARIFVGQKGSGKTVYIRRAKEFAQGSRDLFACDLEHDPPSTEQIVHFSKYFEKYILRETWAEVWRKAIFRSVISYIITNRQLSVNVPTEIRDHLVNDYKILIRPDSHYRTQLGVFQEVSDILSLQTRNSITNYLKNHLWAQLENELHQALTFCKPVCLYIDGIDDEFHHAPMHWLECQLGLFQAITSLLRNPKFGGRLHVFATIRDIVYIKLLQDEHALRNFEEPHIRHLTWSLSSVKYLLDEKVSRLDDEFFLKNDQSEKTVSKWLGVTSFDNKLRNMEENVVQYILRHTRRLPRDVITLGNVLCQETQRVKWYPDVYSIDEAIGIATRFVAKKIGTEQLAVCANHISTDQEPEALKSRGNRFNTYIGNDEYKRSLVDDIKDFIFSFRKDRFSIKTLKKNQAKAYELFGQASNIYNVLWLNGILGYINNQNDDCVTFYIENRVADFKFPLNKRFYAFHSCITDCVGLKPVGKPVVQCE